MPPSPEKRRTSKSSQTEKLRVGQIVGAFGLKGQLKVQPLTDFLDRFQKGSRLMLDGEWVDVEAMSIHKGRPLVKLAGVNTIDAAEALQWHYLEAFGRPEMDDDEYLTKDLVGLEVVTEDGRSLGTVDQVADYPAHDLLIIGDIMIPLVKEFVIDIDLDAAKITVRLIPGMLPE